jgi:hypothetical protein
MDYLIISNPPYTNTVKIGLKLSPENEPLKFFLSGTKLHRFPELLESAILPDGFVNEVSLYRPYEVMDWEDIQNAKGIKEGEAEIYHQIFGSTNINQNIFNKILFDYSVKLFEVYHKSKEVPDGWAEEMEAGIKKLKEKIESRA